MISLRPVRPEDVEHLARWRNDAEAAGEFQWYGFGSTQHFREQVANDALIDADGGTLAVVEGDTLVGDVSWRRVQTGALAHSWCWNIGVIVLAQHRGKGYGTAAQRMLTEYLFQHTPVERIDASTDVDNVAEQRALEKSGFTREGVSRRFMWQGGRWRDYVVYSKLRGEP